ncbi:hypothetical protein EBR57_03465, partial [bacterium]|nr:hypothetical protein [bacterium]
AFFDFVEGVKGIGDASRAFGFIDGEALPVISGNVSLYNESKTGSAVIPSPVIVVIGRVDDYRRAVTMQLAESGLHLIRIGTAYAEFGGTQVRELVPELNEVAPQVRFAEESRANRVLHAAMQEGLVAAAHDISGGGLLGAVFEMVLGQLGQSHVGVMLTPSGDPLTALYSESGGYVVAIRTENLSRFESMMSSVSQSITVVGHTCSTRTVKVVCGDVAYEIPLEDVRIQWNPEI